MIIRIIIKYIIAIVESFSKSKFLTSSFTLLEFPVSASINLYMFQVFGFLCLFFSCLLESSKSWFVRPLDLSYSWFLLEISVFIAFKSSNPRCEWSLPFHSQGYLNFDFRYKSRDFTIYDIYSRNTLILIETRINIGVGIPLWLLSTASVGRKIPIYRAYNVAINMYYLDDAMFDKSPHANHVPRADRFLSSLWRLIITNGL